MTLDRLEKMKNENESVLGFGVGGSLLYPHWYIINCHTVPWESLHSAKAWLEIP